MMPKKWGKRKYNATRFWHANGKYVPGFVDVMTGVGKEGSSYMRIYYPSNLDSKKDFSSRKAVWLAEDETIEGMARISLMNFFLHALAKISGVGSVKIHAVVDAPIADTPSQFPVIIFCHGLLANRYLHSSVCCELASHGYLVASLEFRDTSAIATWYPAENGSRKWIYGGYLDDRDFFRDKNKQRSAERVAETLRAYDLICRINSGDETPNQMFHDFELMSLKGRLDLSRLFLMGHSFGGATALACFDKIPASACVVLDPWAYPLHIGENFADKLDKPILCIMTEQFQTADNLQECQRYFSGQQPGSRVNYTIRGAHHFSQSDVSFLVPLSILHEVKITTANSITNALVLEFLAEFTGLSMAESLQQVLAKNNDLLVNDLSAGCVFMPCDRAMNWYRFLNYFLFKRKPILNH